MPLDGATLRCLCNELDSSLTGGRVDKIFMPEKDEIIINIRSLGGNYRLLLSANPSLPRVHLTTSTKENPDIPPAFCMLLRKHLSGGRISGFVQHGLERSLEISFENKNELGDLETKRLIIEIMGRHSNIILVRGDEKIADCVRHIDATVSSVRQVLPGMNYSPPPTQNKLSPFDVRFENLLDIIHSAPVNTKADKFILEKFSGLSPLLCRELTSLALGNSDIAFSQSIEEREALAKSCFTLFQAIAQNHFSPIMIFENSTNSIMDYSCFKITQYGEMARIENTENVSNAMDFYFTAKDMGERLRQRYSDMLKNVNNIIERCKRKAELQRQSLADAEQKDKFKEQADLIIANIYQIKKGDRVLEAQNYFDPECPAVSIPLDPVLTASQNAQRLYHRYNKLKSTAIAAQKQLENSIEELEYLETVYTSIQNSTTPKEIIQIRQELAEQGYMSKITQQKGRKVKPEEPKPQRFVSSDGFEILVGKNNRQNDYLTLKIAKSHDIWFHTKIIPGSHTVIVTNRQPVPERTMTEAAMLASYHSKAKDGENIPVDYTEIRNVKKPSGAKPGMVIYVNYKTAYSTPNKELVEKLRG